MTEFVPSEKGTPIRFPSTANLYIDSLDRSGGSSSDFLISKNQNILTGFFTRLAVQEVVLDWCVPNIRAVNENNTFTVDVSGSGVQTITLPDDFYNVKQALDTIVSYLNTAYGNTDFSITPTPTGSGVFLTNVNDYTITETNLSRLLNITGAEDATIKSKFVECPKLLNTVYIDFVSNQLTYNQDLKDASTAPIVRDTLYRWYFAWDNEPSYDAYGYPILQGYRSFIQRRNIAFPKQIKWDNIQPIGQVAFQVYDDGGTIVDTSSGEFEFNMNFLVSEV